MLTLSPDDARDHYWVEVTITPKSSQEDMLRSQLAQAFRAPGPTGAPLMSDLDLHENILRSDDPAGMVARASAQMFELTDPEIAEIRSLTMRENWKKDNKDMVREFEKLSAPDAQFERLRKSLTPEKLEKLIKVAAAAEHAKMMGQDPAEAVAQMQQMAMMQQQQAAAPQVPDTVLPFQEQGPSPEVAPTQMGMTQAPQPMEMTPELLATQMRRGKPQP